MLILKWITRTFLRVFVGLAVVAGAMSCTPSQYAAQADKTAYRTLTQGQRRALGEPLPFEVDYNPYCQTAQSCIIVGEKSIPLDLTGEPVVLTLDEALSVALSNSRAYQDRKETLYIQALAVANARREWEGLGRFFGEIDGDVSRTSVGNEQTDDFGQANVTAGVLRRLVNGGIFAVAASLDMATSFTGSTTNIADSLISANFTQPLLQGAWNGLAYEPQYRLERDFLFAVYDYERYRQQFAADIVTRYYQVVRQRDQLENERANIARLKQTVALTRTMVEAGAAPRYELDEAEQNLLQAQVRLQSDDQNYSNALDLFKLTLGLPIQANMELNYPATLEDLAQAGPLDIPLQQDQAIDLALRTRPDVLSQEARLRDAQKDIEIAANRFLPQLDLVLDYSAPGTPTQDFWRIRFQDSTRRAGLQFNYQLDQTDNRDAYRVSMLNRDKARRDLDEFLDRVRLDVRSAYRELLQSRQTYELQLKNVALAKRRRTLTMLEQQAGRAAARDVLDAEEALRNAQNGLTSALVSYTTTRLEFLARLGLISIDEEGVLNERSEPITFQRIAQRYPYVWVEQ